MIERSVWMDQMRRYVRFVADEAAIRRAWIGAERLTSATDFDELFEQIFDDLDADGLEQQMLGEGDAEAQALRGFLEAMRHASETQSTTTLPSVEFLESREWRELHSSAVSALKVLQ